MGEGTQHHVNVLAMVYHHTDSIIFSLSRFLKSWWPLLRMFGNPLVPSSQSSNSQSTHIPSFNCLLHYASRRHIFLALRVEIRQPTASSHRSYSRLSLRVPSDILFFILIVHFLYLLSFFSSSSSPTSIAVTHIHLFLSAHCPQFPSFGSHFSIISSMLQHSLQCL